MLLLHVQFDTKLEVGMGNQVATAHVDAVLQHGFQRRRGEVLSAADVERHLRAHAPEMLADMENNGVTVRQLLEHMKGRMMLEGKANRRYALNARSMQRRQDLLEGVTPQQQCSRMPHPSELPRNYSDAPVQKPDVTVDEALERVVVTVWRGPFQAITPQLLHDRVDAFSERGLAYAATVLEVLAAQSNPLLQPVNENERYALTLRGLTLWQDVHECEPVAASLPCLREEKRRMLFVRIAEILRDEAEYTMVSVEFRRRLFADAQWGSQRNVVTHALAEFGKHGLIHRGYGGREAQTRLKRKGAAVYRWLTQYENT